MLFRSVIKDFRLSIPVTNLVTITPPTLTLHTPALLHWTGLSQLAYTVQTNDALDGWKHAGTALFHHHELLVYECGSFCSVQLLPRGLSLTRLPGSTAPISRKRTERVPEHEAVRMERFPSHEHTTASAQG